MTLGLLTCAFAWSCTSGPEKSPHAQFISMSCACGPISDGDADATAAFTIAMRSACCNVVSCFYHLICVYAYTHLVYYVLYHCVSWSLASSSAWRRRFFLPPWRNVCSPMAMMTAPWTIDLSPELWCRQRQMQWYLHKACYEATRLASPHGTINDLCALNAQVNSSMLTLEYKIHIDRDGERERERGDTYVKIDQNK